MQEVAFLKRNSAKWKRLEELLDSGSSADPDQLAELFLEVTDDLSYSRTFFPDSKTTTYLNALAGRIYQAVYRNKKEDRLRFARFWRQELPSAFYHSHRQLLYSFLIFIFALFIGALSAANDDGFARLILGDRYVNMTLQNIANDDPMAVYKEMHQMPMFLGITLNNLKVACLCFAGGILFSCGSFWILFFNGIMIGTFQYFFYEQGLLLTSALTIWIHGTLEVSSIIISGAAGLTMGNSLLFPGTLSRRQSLMRGARQGLKIIIGILPIIMAAGFLEGFVTRHTEMPIAASLFIIFGSLTFIIWYFIVYPIRLQGNKEEVVDAG